MSTIENVALHMVIADDLGMAGDVADFERLLPIRLGPGFDSDIFPPEFFGGSQIDSSSWTGKLIIAAGNDQFAPAVETPFGVFVCAPYGYDPRICAVRDDGIYLNYAINAVNGRHELSRLTVPVKIDMTTSSRAQFYPLPVPQISSPEQEATLSSKIDTLQQLENAGVQTPRRHAYISGKEAQRFIHDGVGLVEVLKAVFNDKEKPDRVVLKPNRGSHGGGIILLSKLEFARATIMERYRGDIDPGERQSLFFEDIGRAFEELGFRGGLIIEDEVKARVISGYDGCTWNIRAYLVGGETIGMYARVGDARRPVNMTYRAGGQSARGFGVGFEPMVKTMARKLSDIGGLSEEEVHIIEATLDRIKDRFPYGIKGVDIIVTEDGATVLEVNGFNSGGIGTMSGLDGNSDLAHRAVEVLIQEAVSGNVFPSSCDRGMHERFMVGYLSDRVGTALNFLGPDLRDGGAAKKHAIRAGNAIIDQFFETLETHKLRSLVDPRIVKYSDQLHAMARESMALAT